MKHPYPLRRNYKLNFPVLPFQQRLCTIIRFVKQFTLCNLGVEGVHHVTYSGFFTTPSPRPPPPRKKNVSMTIPRDDHSTILLYSQFCCESHTVNIKIKQISYELEGKHDSFLLFAESNLF